MSRARQTGARIVLAFALFALVPSLVSAAINITVVRHDTDVQSTYQQLKTCSCGGTVDSFRVKNVGDLESYYRFTLEGNQPWFTLDREGLWLPPGGSADVYVFTQAPCDAVATGTYTVYVASEYGRYRAFEKTVQTGVCQNIQADVQPVYAEVQPCDEQLFHLTLTNVGTFTETYAIDGLSFPSSVTLAAGQTETLVGGYTASCTEWGTKDIPVTVTSTKNGLRDTTHVTIAVPRAYDYTLRLDEPDRPVCAGVTSAVPVAITNDEDRANVVSLHGEPASASLNVSVGAQATAGVQLPFTPQRAGEQPFTVSATGRDGGIAKQATVVIPVEACYDISMTAPASVAACAGEVHIPFTITDEGTQRQTLALDVRSNVSTRIDSLRDDISPGQVLTKTITAELPDADRQYYVTLEADNGVASAQATTTVTAYSTESCYAIAPTNHRFRIWTDQETVPVIVAQDGVQPGDYEVHYEGRFMRPLEQRLTLAPGQQAVLHFTINSTGFAPGRYVDRLTLRSHGVDYTTDFEVTLREKGFWQHFLDAWRWNGDFALCSVVSALAALLLLAVILLVIGIMVGRVVYERPARWSRETIGIVGAAALVLLLFAMLATVPAVPRSYERPIAPANASALFYELGEGQELTLDLGALFADPDSDSLVFTSNQPDKLQVRIAGDAATVKANDHWRGQESLVFTASDGRGGVTDSDVITVSVVPYKPVSFLDYWQHACWFLVSLFLFLATGIALLAALFLGDEKRGPSQRALVLYRRPRTEVLRGHAQELVEQADTRIQQLPPGTKPTQVGQVIGTQVQAGQIVINQSGKESLFVASQDGTRYHRITCPVVKGMPKDKRITFNTREDAIKAGYTPCKTCSSH